ncbi:uncharacterized protein METZ01_LOCUS142449, partial [marine metagenome]
VENKCKNNTEVAEAVAVTVGLTWFAVRLPWWIIALA